MEAKPERKTRQKEAIREAFEAAGRPLSPQEALDVAQREVDKLGIATVYRNIRSLVESAWLVPVEMADGTTYYERAGKAHHHHFHCDDCNRVFDMDGCALTSGKLGPRGFQVRRHEIVLYGTCADCRKR